MDIKDKVSHVGLIFKLKWSNRITVSLRLLEGFLTDQMLEILKEACKSIRSQDSIIRPLLFLIHIYIYIYIYI